jgi:hypothetical protein
MESEWLEVAYINFGKAILHGQINTKQDYYPKEIVQVLTKDQVKEIEDLNFKHERAMRALLKGFVNGV